MIYSFRTEDHPEANGRVALYGETAFKFYFPLEEGGKLFVDMGETGLDALRTIVEEAIRDRDKERDRKTKCNP